MRPYMQNMNPLLARSGILPFTAALLVALLLSACGGSKSDPKTADSTQSKTPASEKQAEKDDKAGVIKDIDEAHRDFKKEIKPAADYVDNTTRKVVREGKKVIGADSDDENDKEDDSDQTADDKAEQDDGQQEEKKASDGK